MEMKGYDFVAIGGGEAGLAAVAKVASAGRRTALVDCGPVGGLCSLNGCNPKKVLVRTTEVLEEIRRAAEYGIQVSEPRVDWSRVIDRKEGFTRDVTPSTERWLAEQGIDLIHGAPRFVSENTLEIDGERIEAGGILIATGSTPRPLTFEGAELVKTSDDILALRQVPRQLTIIGAGVVAFEFGQVFARLGSRVTMLAPGKRVLARHDPDLVDTVVQVSASLGVELIRQARVQAVRREGELLTVQFLVDGQTRTTGADFLLNAAGRIPAIDTLALDRAGVERDTRGVLVNEFLRSRSTPRVFAAGDAHGRMQLSPVASYEGQVAARNFLEGDTERVSYDAIPRVLFTVPPLASVGLTEGEARERGLDLSVITQDMTDWKVPAILGEPVAHAKVIVESGSGRILGAHLLSSGAAEDIHVFAMAIRFGLTADDLKSVVFGYPTLASALSYTLG
jgi:glutathione reductase (NADPH)